MGQKIPAGYKLVTVQVDIPVVVPVAVADPKAYMDAAVGAFWAGRAQYVGVKYGPDMLLGRVQAWFMENTDAHAPTTLGHPPTTLAHALQIMDTMASAARLAPSGNDLRREIRALRAQQWQVLNAGIRQAIAGTNLAQRIAQELAEETLTPAQAVAALRTLPPTTATDALIADLIRYRDAWFAGQEAEIHGNGRE